MGLYAQDKTLWVATVYWLYRFDDVFEEGQQQNGYDRFMSRVWMILPVTLIFMMWLWTALAGWCLSARV